MERKLDWKLQMKNLRLGEVKQTVKTVNFLGTKLVFDPRPVYTRAPDGAFKRRKI